jgi:pimeloyl-ACP methyl ester carboxylesterase
VLADYPGTASSPKVADPAVIDADYICRGLGRVIDSISGPVDLLVHSMSGPYGLALLQSHGPKIDHLVAVAPGQPPELSTPPTAVEDLGDSVRVTYGTHERIFPKHGWTEGTLDFVRTCIGPGSRFPDVDPEIYRASLSPLWAGLSIEIARTLLDPPPLNPDLTGGSVLVVCAAADPMVSTESCSRYVEWLGSHGAKAELMDLDALGVKGNAHMMMLEENSSQIAGMIIDWLQR